MQRLAHIWIGLVAAALCAVLWSPCAAMAQSANRPVALSGPTAADVPTPPTSLTPPSGPTSQTVSREAKQGGSTSLTRSPPQESLVAARQRMRALAERMTGAAQSATSQTSASRAFPGPGSAVLVKDAEPTTSADPADLPLGPSTDRVDPSPLSSRRSASLNKTAGRSGASASNSGRGEGSLALGLSETTSTGSWVLSTLTALGVVVGLILLLRYGWQKMGGRVVARQNPMVEVLSRTSVAPKNHVLLLRVGQRVLIVGDSSSGLRTLAQVTDPEEVAELLASVTTNQEQSISKNFSQLLSRFGGDYDQPRLAEEGTDDGEFQFDRARDRVSKLASRLRMMALGGVGGAGGGEGNQPSAVTQLDRGDRGNREHGGQSL